MAVSRSYYGRTFGLLEPFEFRDRAITSVAFLKLNDRQFIELYPGFKPGQARIAHVCLETGDIDTVVHTLTAAGLAPTAPNRARAGNLLSSVHDPEDNLVEFLEYLPGSLHSNAVGGGMSEDRLATAIRYVVFASTRPGATGEFYRRKLGFAVEPFESGVRIWIPGPGKEWIELRGNAGAGCIGLAARNGTPTERRTDPNGVTLELLGPAGKPRSGN